MVCIIFLAYLSGLTVFFFNLTARFLWLPRFYILHFVICAFFHLVILDLSHEPVCYFNPTHPPNYFQLF